MLLIKTSEHSILSYETEKENACVDVSDIASDKQPPETSTGQMTHGGVVPTECIMSQ